MERKKFVSSSILRQSNGLSKYWLGFIVLFLLFICTFLNEVKMVNSCIAIGCTNHAKPGSGISFHAFPHKNCELLQKWIQAVKEKTGYQTNTLLSVVTTLNHSFCCQTRESGCRLFDNSVPTIFPSFPAYYQKEQRKRKLSI